MWLYQANFDLLLFSPLLLLYQWPLYTVTYCFLINIINFCSFDNLAITHSINIFIRSQLLFTIRDYFAAPIPNISFTLSVIIAVPLPALGARIWYAITAYGCPTGISHILYLYIFVSYDTQVAACVEVMVVVIIFEDVVLWLHYNTFGFHTMTLFNASLRTNFLLFDFLIETSTLRSFKRLKFYISFQNWRQKYFVWSTNKQRFY